MAFGREYISVARTNGSADVFCLAGFLRDDDLIRHAKPFRTKSNSVTRLEHKGNIASSQPTF